MAALRNMCRNSQTFLRIYSVKQNHSAIAQSLVLNYHLNVHRNKVTQCQHFKQVGFLSTTSLRTCVRAVKFPFGFVSENVYSTQAKGGTGLTEDILKSKIGQITDDTNTDNQNKDEQINKSDNKKSDDKKSKENWFSGKHAWKLGILSLGAMGLVMCGNMILMWGRPLLDKEGNEIEDEFSAMPKWKGYPLRAYKEAHFFKMMIEEPSYKKLLPDPLKEPWYQPPYTLVIELTGVLVHPDWTLGTGWRFKKRPAITYFLQQIASPLFEVVVFTHEQGFTAFPIVDGLDPNGHVMFRLFRDATRYMNGSHVKDLDCLNRDLSKVIIIDCDPKAFQKHPANAFLLKKWTGDESDRTLVDLASFLRTVAMSNVEDVRTVLEHYNQFDDPLEAFKENQKRLQGEQERAKVAVDQQDKKKPLAGYGLSFMKRR